MQYQVRVLKMGQCDVPGPEIFWMSHWDKWYTLYFYMVVIQGGGQTILINTGPPSDLTALNEVWQHFAGPRCQMIRAEDERPRNALGKLNIRPEQVDYVLITPLQSYADANIPLFPNATICISRRGWIEDFHAPRHAMHIPRKLRLPDEALHYLDIEAPEKLRLVEDGEILPGLRCFWAGAHHRSSMAYCIETAQGTTLVTDSVFKYGNLEQNHPLGIAESLEECFHTYQRIRREAQIVIPLYDPDVLERYPGGVIA